MNLRKHLRKLIAYKKFIEFKISGMQNQRKDNPNPLVSIWNPTKMFSFTFIVLVSFVVIFNENLFCRASKYEKMIGTYKENDYFLQLRNLVENVFSKTKIHRCYATITDKIHQHIFQNSIFESKNFPKVNFFLTVLESEDLLSPNYVTVRLLKEIKKYDCDLILVIILNGIQVERLLTFIDDNRVLNTRAKYIFLYDYRIFAKYVLHIWKKIVTVIFVRKRETIDRNSGQAKIGFEILTVPYPNTFHDVFITKKICEWKRNKFDPKVNIFQDKTRDLKGKMVKIVLCQHIPMVSVQYNRRSDIFSGIEMEIINSLAKVMNFTPNFYQTGDFLTEKWGRRLLNGTYTGLIGEMVNGRANMAIGDLHFSPFNMRLMDLSVPHTTECLTFLTPESTKDNAWKTLIVPFSGSMWAGIILSMLSVGSIFYGLSYVQENIRNPGQLTMKTKNTHRRSQCQRDIFDNFSNCIFLTYSMLLQVSLPKMPMKWPIRILTGWYWIYCFLVVVAYRASFTAILANPSARITIDSLKELSRSNIIPGAWGAQNKEFFTNAFDVASRIVGAKMEQVDNLDSVVDRIVDGKYAYYDNEFYLRHLRATNGKKTGKETLHIMKTCVVNMPISLGLEKNSPLKPNVDKYLKLLVESGLMAKWLKETTSTLNAEEEPPQEALINLKKFWSSFVALAIGYFISFLAFVGETLHFKYIVQKHPLYDRYNPRAYYEFIQSQ